jgi:hypothetical protein
MTFSLEKTSKISMEIERIDVPLPNHARQGGEDASATGCGWSFGQLICVAATVVKHGWTIPCVCCHHLKIWRRTRHRKNPRPPKNNRRRKTMMPPARLPTRGGVALRAQGGRSLESATEE